MSWCLTVEIPDAPLEIIGSFHNELNAQIVGTRVELELRKRGLAEGSVVTAREMTAALSWEAAIPWVPVFERPEES